MDTTTTKSVQEAFELLKAGKRTEAHALLVPIVKQNPDIAQAWYLLGFTVTDTDKKRYCFRQVLRIDPAHQAAQKQLDRLVEAERVVPEVGAFKVDTFPVATPAFVTTPRPAPAPSNQTLPKNHALPKNQATPKNQRVLLIGIALAVLAVIVVLGASALYVSNGTNISQQVAALFAQRKCVEVVKYTSFGESFPRFVFSSLFDVYEQVEECQAQLALEQAIQAQDWPAAYSIIENYLVVHQSGAFVTDMNEQAGIVLLAWSKNFVAQNDFKTAIEKLELIQRGFPTSSVVPSVSKVMYDDYLLWAKYLYEQKDYQSAEQTLLLVASQAQASPEQLKQADQGLAVVYFQWAKTKVEEDKYDEALQYYEAAKNLNPGLVDYDRLKDQITLLRVTDLVQASDFDAALAMTRDMSETALSEQGKLDAVAEETKILDAYAHSDSEQAKAQMIAAATNMCKKELPTMPIFAKDAETIRFAIAGPFENLQIPEEWTARTPSELHYIVCIAQSQSRVETCFYRFGHNVRRNRFVWSTTVYDILTGKAIKTNRFQGGEPRRCAQTEYFYGGSSVSDLYGDLPKMQRVLDWLTSLKLSDTE